MGGKKRPAGFIKPKAADLIERKAVLKMRRARREYIRRFTEYHDVFRREELRDMHDKARSPERKKAILAERDNLLTVTPEIKEFAKDFNKTEQGIEAMFTRLVNFKVKLVKEKPTFAEYMYGKQTAHDILTSGKIPVVHHRGEPQWGCKSLCVLALALLKAKGIKAKHVRTVNNIDAPHSILDFKLGNRRYLVDLFENGRTSFVGERMVQVGMQKTKEIEELKKKGRWLEQPLNKKFFVNEYQQEFDSLRAGKGLPKKKKQHKK
jgi:hypothetical protein